MDENTNRPTVIKGEIVLKVLCIARVRLRLLRNLLRIHPYINSLSKTLLYCPETNSDSHHGSGPTNSCGQVEEIGTGCRMRDWRPSRGGYLPSPWDINLLFSLFEKHICQTEHRRLPPFDTLSPAINWWRFLRQAHPQQQ